MTDTTIICTDCGQEFAWTAGEQQFYLDKGLPKPEHCMICRGKYKAMNQDASKYGQGGSKVLQNRK